MTFAYQSHTGDQLRSFGVIVVQGKCIVDGLELEELDSIGIKITLVNHSSDE